MKQQFAGLAVLSLFVIIGDVTSLAYERPTHRDMSEHGVERSVLRTESKVLEALGLKPLSAIDRTTNEQFPNYRNERHDIFDLVGDGSEFEDNGDRASNHFYDPVRGRAASPCDSDLGYEISPDWALEGRRQFDGQEDSFADTRKFFFDALTSQKHVDRDRAWGRTFQGLGQVIHHLQDMAQPQHVRNDLHFAYTPLPLPCIGGPSFYERYTNRDEVRPRLPYDQSDSRYEPVDITTFNVPRKFWDTEDGRGIAEYTNRGFVSAGTNFLDPRNAFSDPTVAGVSEEDMTAECDRLEISRPSGSDGKPLPCLMSFVRTFVEDRYRPDVSKVNERASTYSIFNDTLETYYNTKLYSLNRFNFEAGYRFLIPRAVGYSAGLINYFFRGKIDLVHDPTDPSAYLIYNNGTEELKGAFTLYYDDVNGDRRSAARWDTAMHLPDSQGVLAPNGGSMHVPTVSPFLSPAPQTPGTYLLVFKGDMGEEKLPPMFPYIGGIAAKVVTMPPSFLIPTGRLQYTNDWQFTPQSDVHFGNIDWRGTAGSVSWLGPHSRYDEQGRALSELSLFIWAHGQVLATAPGPVLGAALQRDGTLVTIVQQSIGSQAVEVLYRKSVGGEWEPMVTIGVMQYSESTSPRPWFFDAEGQHAVSVKWWNPHTEQGGRSLARCAVAASLCTFEVPENTVLENTVTSTYCDRNNPYDCTEVYQWVRHDIAHTFAADYRGTELLIFDREYIGHGTFNTTWGPRYTGNCWYRTFVYATTGQFTSDRVDQSYLVSTTSRDLTWQKESHDRVDYTTQEQPTGGGNCRVMVDSTGTYTADELDAYSPQYWDLRSPDSPLLVLLPMQWQSRGNSTFQGPSFPPGHPAESGDSRGSTTVERYAAIRGGGLPAPITLGTETASIVSSYQVENSKIVNSQSTTTGPYWDLRFGRIISQPGSFVVDAQGNFLVSFPHYETFVSQPPGAAEAAGLTTPVPVGVE